MCLWLFVGGMTIHKFPWFSGPKPSDCGGFGTDRQDRTGRVWTEAAHLEPPRNAPGVGRGQVRFQPSALGEIRALLVMKSDIGEHKVPDMPDTARFSCENPNVIILNIIHKYIYIYIIFISVYHLGSLETQFPSPISQTHWIQRLSRSHGPRQALLVGYAQPPQPQRPVDIAKAGCLLELGSNTIGFPIQSHHFFGGWYLLFIVSSFFCGPCDLWMKWRRCFFWGRGLLTRHREEVQ